MIDLFSCVMSGLFGKEKKSDPASSVVTIVEGMGKISGLVVDSFSGSAADGGKDIRKVRGFRVRR
ncbi:hypothetical protein CHISP_2537 [Chitinispirillum alkaliphilum]|nr:hypothetical protein CHISP_2537 [Chitinispirillum alkaliphilum]